MNKSKNIIKSSEVTITPILVKYAATHSIGDYTGKIKAYVGANIPRNQWSFYNYSNPLDPGECDTCLTSHLNYRLVQQLYYQNYLTGSVLNASSSWNWNQQSTACSGSNNYENRYFPTESNKSISTIYVLPSLFGEQISRNTFHLKPRTGTNYDIVDDGNGNLIDKLNSNAHVGNIIYSQGVIVITNTYYSKAFVDN